MVYYNVLMFINVVGCNIRIDKLLNLIFKRYLINLSFVLFFFNSWSFKTLCLFTIFHFFFFVLKSLIREVVNTVYLKVYIPIKINMFSQKSVQLDRVEKSLRLKDEELANLRQTHALYKNKVWWATDNFLSRLSGIRLAFFVFILKPYYFLRNHRSRWNWSKTKEKSLSWKKE